MDVQVHKSYAQNPFNPSARLSNVASTTQNTSSGSTVSRAAGLGLSTASRPIPGAIPSGADIGIAAALFLGSASSKSSHGAINQNYLIHFRCPITKKRPKSKSEQL